MEYGPDRLLRMLALNQGDKVLASRDIWLCTGCYTCATRCPNGIDIASVMDALRLQAVARGYPAGEPDALLFHKSFLTIIGQLGRSHEATLLGLFKLLSHKPFFSDLRAGLGLFLRGKVPVLPGWSGAGGGVRQMVRQARRSRALRQSALPARDDRGGP
jgi:heterodisulfide reductase subunit C